MYVEIITTITSKIPVNDDGIGTPEHSVDIDPGELLEVGGKDLVMTVVYGSLTSTQNAVLEQSPRLAKRIAAKAEEDARCPYDCDVCRSGEDED